MIRAAHYRDRPNQADQLHLDVWWQGINVACDSGAYLYNGTPPWQNALATTAVHNTVGVDEQDQMTRAGRFLWLDWAQASCEVVRSPHQQIERWRGSHNGYRRLDSRLDHVREVLRLGDDHWLVRDSLVGQKSHRFRLHWLLANFPHRWEEATGRLRLETPAGEYVVQVGSTTGHAQASIVVGDPNSTRGWRSRYYGDREPAISLALEMAGVEARFWTLLGPAGANVEIAADKVRVTGLNWHAEIEIDSAFEHRIGAVRWKGNAGEDSLEIPLD
jgi:asparagine synthase (glutamine-hydrolysing)